MKKSLLVCALVILGTFTLSAQGSSEEIGSKIEKPVLLRCPVQQSHYMPGFDKMVQKLEEEENIKLDVQVIPDAQYDNLIKMQINSGEAPDLIDYNQPGICGVLPPEKYLYDLSEQPWVDKLLAPENIKWEDGHIYGFPFQSINGFQCIIYNKDAFKAAGIDGVPTTHTEFVDDCNKLKEFGIDPVLFSAEVWQPQMFMTSGYARIFETPQKAKEVTDSIFSGESEFVDYPEFSTVIDDFTSIFANGFVSKDWLTTANDDNVIRIAKGEGGMLMGNGMGSVAAIYRAFPDANIGLFNYPTEYSEDLLSITAFSIGFSVYKNSSHIKECLKVLECFAKPEYADMWFEDGRTSFPAFDGVYGGEIPQISQDIYNEYVLTHRCVPEMNTYFDPIRPLFKSTMFVFYQEAAQGRMNGEELLIRLQESVNKLLKSKNVQGF